MTQKLGPLMLDLEGTRLTGEEKELLQHPAVGGLIYFTRNFESAAQISELSAEIRALRKEEILICVDHEGGRVQRFREDFTRLPACRPLGKVWDADPAKALADARQLGWIMAAELLVCGIDFSFAPVLDLDYTVSQVIGDRAFHTRQDAVIEIAAAYMQGMHQAGMMTTGKHYPGHGAVQEDSHYDLPVDKRPLEQIMETDMKPFVALAEQGLMDAVMPAHVIYQQADSQPAGFSSYWLQTIMRQQMRYDGVIFSDDLNMAAAGVAGSFSDRAKLALSAGCDMILVCNNRQGAIEVLDAAESLPVSEQSTQRLSRMHGQVSQRGLTALHADPQWQQAKSVVDEYRQQT